MTEKTMVPLRLEPFRDEETGIDFRGAWDFGTGGKHLLLGADGNILLLSDSLAEQLRAGKTGDDLAIRLLQRGFAGLTADAGKDTLSAEACGREEIAPGFFMIDLTDRCNMACRYCLRDSNAVSGSRIMSRRTAERIVSCLAEYCRRQQMDQIVIQPWGGEPLLAAEMIWFIQDALAAEGVQAQFTLETNGLLLTEETCAELYRRRIAVGVSIDGGPAVHDSQRVRLDGSPTFAAAAAGIRRLQKWYGDAVTVIATLTRQSAGGVGGILDYFAGELGLTHIKCNYVHASSFHENLDMCLSPAEIRSCASEILDKVVGYAERGILLNEYNLYTRIINLLVNPQTDACISHGCLGGRRLITFDSEGGIYPCDVTDYPEERLGSVYSGEPLTELLRREIPLKPYFTGKYSEACGTCPWRPYCRGGCTVHTKCLHLPAGSVDPIECAVNRAVYPRLAELILTRPEIINLLAEQEILN